MKMAPDPEKRIPEDECDERELEEDEPEAVLAGDPDHPPCPRCGWHNTRPSHTKTILDPVLRALSVKAFRCRSCGKRFYKLRRAKKS